MQVCVGAVTRRHGCLCVCMEIMQRQIATKFIEYVGQAREIAERTLTFGMRLASLKADVAPLRLSKASRIRSASFVGNGRPSTKIVQ